MLRIADKTFDSHLFTGTGKFASSQLMVEAIRASGSQLVTLAMKRVDLRQHNDAILEPLIGCHHGAGSFQSSVQSLQNRSSTTLSSAKLSGVSLASTTSCTRS